jgi:tyrosyl-tRNA synthetase
MGKTEGGAIWLNADLTSPYDYYQYWRNVEDADVAKLLKVFTLLPMNEITRLEKLQGQDINEAKRVLAFETTKLAHGANAAQEAEKTARNVFERGSVGSDLPSFPIDEARLKKGVALIELLVEVRLAASKSEARRLIQGGGIKCDDSPVTDENYIVTANDLAMEDNGNLDDNWIKLSAGKKRHALVRVK